MQVFLIFIPSSTFHSILVLQHIIGLGSLFVFLSPPQPLFQSLHWWFTPHNFPAVLVCDRGCRWIVANKAVCSYSAGGRGGEKGRHFVMRHLDRAVAATAYRNFLRGEEPCRMCARLTVTHSGRFPHSFHLEIMRSSSLDALAASQKWKTSPPLRPAHALVRTFQPCCRPSCFDRDTFPVRPV